MTLEIKHSPCDVYWLHGKWAPELLNGQHELRRHVVCKEELTYAWDEKRSAKTRHSLMLRELDSESCIERCIEAVKGVSVPGGVTVSSG